MIIPYKKHKTAKEAYEAIKSKLTNNYFDRFKIKGEFKYDSKKMLITAAGTGFTFQLKFKDKEAEGDLELSFLLRPLKSTITSTVEKNLKGVL